MEWISVEEELAPPHVDVIGLYEDGDVFMARVCYGMHAPFWCDNNHREDPSDTMAKKKVIGWMRCPKNLNKGIK